MADYVPPEKWPLPETMPEPLGFDPPEYELARCPGWLKARLRERCTGYPPIWHGDGTVTLWHPDSPGSRLRVRPSLLRRHGIIRSPFATLSEAMRVLIRAR